MKIDEQIQSLNGNGERFANGSPTTTLPQGVYAYNDRHGKRRFRYRVAGQRGCDLPSPTSPSFEQALADARQGVRVGPARQRAIARMADVRRYAFEQFAFRVVAKAKERSSSRIPFALTAEHVIALAERQDYRCAVTGIALDISPPKRTRRKPFEPSLDRIRPNLGYVEGNVRVVCNIVNFAMNEWGEDALWDLVRRCRCSPI